MSDREKMLERIDRRHPGIVDALGHDLPFPDVTTALIEAMRIRSGVTSPADVIRQYERDRFVRPAAVDGRALHRVEARMLQGLPARVDVVALSPLAPFATHTALGEISQNNVVSTTRRTEVAADTTAGLALEAAARRRRLLAIDPRSDTTVTLAGVQRVTRAQPFDGPVEFAHFSLFGLVTAGRDTGNRSFEHGSLVDQLSIIVGCLRRTSRLEVIGISLTDFSSRLGDVLESVGDHFRSVDGVNVRLDADRTAARGYYPGVCFSLDVTIDGTTMNIGDGGFVRWTQELTGSRKERLLIGGIGLDRLAGLSGTTVEEAQAP